MPPHPLPRKSTLPPEKSSWTSALTRTRKQPPELHELTEEMHPPSTEKSAPEQQVVQNAHHVRFLEDVMDTVEESSMSEEQVEDLSSQIDQHQRRLLPDVDDEDSTQVHVESLHAEDDEEEVSPMPHEVEEIVLPVSVPSVRTDMSLSDAEREGIGTPRGSLNGEPVEIEQYDAEFDRHGVQSSAPVVEEVGEILAEISGRGVDAEPEAGSVSVEDETVSTPSCIQVQQLELRDEPVLEEDFKKTEISRGISVDDSSSSENCKRELLEEMSDLLIQAEERHKREGESHRPSPGVRDEGAYDDAEPVDEPLVEKVERSERNVAVGESVVTPVAVQQLEEESHVTPTEPEGESLPCINIGGDSEADNLHDLLSSDDQGSDEHEDAPATSVVTCERGDNESLALGGPLLLSEEQSSAAVPETAPVSQDVSASPKFATLSPVADGSSRGPEPQEP